MSVSARIGDYFTIGDGSPFALIAGPCVLEAEEEAMSIGRTVARTCREFGMSYIFKASFDKANRSSHMSPRGPGLKRGLEMLAGIRSDIGVPVTTDVHESNQVDEVAEVVDLIQIPAFLSRQTDLLHAAARTGRAVNVKKGQFLAPNEMKHVVDKLHSAGATEILLTERGTSFGHNDLVVDFRGLPQMRALGYPVVFDSTHSVQRAGGERGVTGGDREFVEPLAAAAAAVGMDALFLEVHPDPDLSPSDAASMLALSSLRNVLRRVLAIRNVTFG